MPPFVLFVLSMVSCNMIAGKTESVPPESLEDALLQVATAIDTNPSTGDHLQSGEAEVESIELEEAENDYLENDYPGNDSSEGDYIDAPVIKDINDLRKIEEKAREAKEFVAQNGMNQDWCLLLDFSYDLYTRRLIVYDLKSNEIIRRELVSHGNGGGSTPSKPVFSNVEGSFCSSLGKYKIGKRAYSNGVSMSTINCMDWNLRIAMRSVGLSCFTLMQAPIAIILQPQAMAVRLSVMM